MIFSAPGTQTTARLMRWPGGGLLLCIVLLTTVGYRTAAAQETAAPSEKAVPAESAVSVPPVARDQPPQPGDEPPDASAAGTADVGTAGVEHGAETAEEHREKEKMANVALVLLVGIASAGILLIAGVLIWGSRVRRISRHREKAAPLDPLWYLRGSPPLEADARPPGDETSRSPGPGSPEADAGPPADPPPRN